MAGANSREEVEARYPLGIRVKLLPPWDANGPGTVVEYHMNSLTKDWWAGVQYDSTRLIGGYWDEIIIIPDPYVNLFL